MTDEILVDNGKRTMTLDELGMTQPGLARIMPEVSIRIWKLYYAGKARNWPLARFQLKEAINLMEVGAFVRPKYEVNMAKFIDEDAGPVGKAIEAGDWDAFDAPSTRWSTRPTPTTTSTTSRSSAGASRTIRRPTST